MAKILVSDSRPSYVSKTVAPNRGSQELSIGKDAKEFLDSYFTTLNDAPSDMGVYFQTAVNETSFSSNLNQQKHTGEANRFNEILDFVMFGPKSDQEMEKREDEDREAAYTPGEQERIILQGTIRPVPGDHWMSYSQGREARLYQITNVTLTKLLDKPIYSVTISPSPSFTIDTIRKNVLNTYRFIFGNIGSKRKTIMVEELYKRSIELSKAMVDLNKMYVNTFYDDRYDVLRYTQLSNEKHYIVLKSLREFQEQFAILRYGNDLNQLFSSYPILYKDGLKDFKLSYSNRIIKRKVPLLDPSKPTDLVDMSGSDLSNIYADDFRVTKLLNDESILMLDDEDGADVLESYRPKYNYTFKFYHNIKTDLPILTHFRKSNIVLMEWNSIPSNPLHGDKEPYITYTVTNDMYRYIFDLYIDKRYNEIMNCKFIEKIIVENNNIDTYICIPVLMYIINAVLDEIETDDLIVSF